MWQTSLSWSLFRCVFPCLSFSFFLFSSLFLSLFFFVLSTLLYSSLSFPSLPFSVSLILIPRAFSLPPPPPQPQRPWEQGCVSFFSVPLPLPLEIGIVPYSVVKHSVGAVSSRGINLVIYTAAVSVPNFKLLAFMRVKIEKFEVSHSPILTSYLASVLNCRNKH